MTWLPALLAAFAAYCLWAAVHELSHALCAKAWAGAHSFQFRLWPHCCGSGFRWASVRYVPTRKRTGCQRALSALAPRLPDAAAAVALPWLADLPLWISVLVGAGLVDLATGSIGRSSRSDLRVASRCLGINPWWLRAGGFLIVAASAAAWALGRV